MRRFLILIALAFTIPLFAQPPVQEPDYENPGATCYTGGCPTTDDGLTVRCAASRHVGFQNNYGDVNGYASCTAHNSTVGPNGCSFSGAGACKWNIFNCGDGIYQPACAKTPQPQYEAQAWAITVALRDAELLPIDELATWMGDVERNLALIADKSYADKLRADAYRAKWNALVPHWQLKVDESPVLARPRTATPSVGSD